MTFLYKNILGKKYDILPKKIQQFHDVSLQSTYRGQCSILRGTNLISNIFANLLLLPKAGKEVEITLNIKVKEKRELWDRRFDGHLFQSCQWQVEDLLYEKLGFLTLSFKLIPSDHRLALRLQKVYVFGIPQMRFIYPKMIARETEKNGKFHFFIKVSLPFLGLLVQYEGCLEKISVKEFQNE